MLESDVLICISSLTLSSFKYTRKKQSGIDEFNIF